jgi:hypothetical protein
LPGAVSTGNTKYSPGAIAINYGWFNELEVAPLELRSPGPYQDDEQSDFELLFAKPPGRTAHPARLALPGTPADSLAIFNHFVS